MKMPVPGFTPAPNDTEGEDAESKIRRLLEAAGFPAGTTAKRVTVHEKEAPKGADALSGAASIKAGIKVQIPFFELCYTLGVAPSEIIRKVEYAMRKA
jgi:hypothetical protein